MGAVEVDDCPECEPRQGASMRPRALYTKPHLNLELIKGAAQDRSQFGRALGPVQLAIRNVDFKHSLISLVSRLESEK